MKFDVHHHDSNLVHLPLKQLLLILIILFFVFIDKLIRPRSLIYHSYADHTQPLSIMSLEVISSEACVANALLVCVTVYAVDDNRIELIWFASRSNPWKLSAKYTIINPLKPNSSNDYTLPYKSNLPFLMSDIRRSA